MSYPRPDSLRGLYLRIGALTAEMLSIDCSHNRRAGIAKVQELSKERSLLITSLKKRFPNRRDHLAPLPRGAAAMANKESN